MCPFLVFMISEMEIFDAPLYYRTALDLESFQNCVLMYACRWFAFAPPVYETRKTCFIVYVPGKF